MEEILRNYKASLLNEGLEKGRFIGFSEGRKEGLSEGRKEGFLEGIEKGEERLVRCICNLSRNDRISVREAMEKLGIPEEYQEALLASCSL